MMIKRADNGILFWIYKSSLLRKKMQHYLFAETKSVFINFVHCSLMVRHKYFTSRFINVFHQDDA